MPTTGLWHPLYLPVSIIIRDQISFTGLVSLQPLQPLQPLQWSNPSNPSKPRSPRASGNSSMAAVLPVHLTDLCSSWHPGVQKGFFYMFFNKCLMGRQWKTKGQIHSHGLDLETASGTASGPGVLHTCARRSTGSVSSIGPTVWHWTHWIWVKRSKEPQGPSGHVRSLQHLSRSSGSEIPAATWDNQAHSASGISLSIPCIFTSHTICGFPSFWSAKNLRNTLHWQSAQPIGKRRNSTHQPQLLGQLSCRWWVFGSKSNWYWSTAWAVRTS